jgi:hypothetical protein
MLVWKAMPSMVPMMSAMRRLLAWISSIVDSTCDTTSPPRVAISAAEAASWLACRAESALCRTVPVSCSIDAAVCCRLLAVDSVRRDRSWLPLAISALAVAMLSELCCTWPTRRCSEACSRLICSSIEQNSSRPSTGTGRDRSPGGGCSA